MRRIVSLSALALAACGRPPMQVQLPVSRPCVSAADVPPPIPPAGPLPEDARQAADLLGATVLLLRANERLLRAMIAPCTG